MRRVVTALAFSVALGGVALPAAATRAGEVGPQSIVAHPAPPDLATLLQRGNPPLVCHLAHSAVRDRQGGELVQTLDGAIEEAFEGTRALVAPDTDTEPPTASAAQPDRAETAVPAVESTPTPAQDEDALTPADIMLMVAALALASLSVLVVRG